MTQRSARRGFTVIEIAVTIGIMVLISVVTFLTLSGQRDTKNLTQATNEVVALLREAQSNSMAAANNAAWGVHFDNVTTTAAFFALYYSTYSSSTQTTRVVLPANVCFSTSSVAAGTSTEIMFNKITGTAAVSTSTSIVLQLVSGGCGS